MPLPPSKPWPSTTLGGRCPLEIVEGFMSRYYFNIRQGADLAQDPEGMELASLELAREEAVGAVRELLSEKLIRGEVVDGQTMEICDEQGRVLQTIAFKDELRMR